MSIGNVAGTSNPVSAVKAQDTHNAASLEKKIEQLKNQAEQIEKNEKLSQEEKDKRIASIENQVARLEQKGQENSKASSAEMRKRFDTYETQPKQPSAGVYQVARDEEGRQIIQVDSSWESAPEQLAAKPHNDSEKPGNEGEKPVIVKTTGNTDKVDREIEKLKQTRTQLRQKIAAAKTPEEKESLEAQLDQVEAELKLKDNDTYRRQHMEITEQKVVSKTGE